jgi:dihydroorotate dehydrogenase
MNAKRAQEYTLRAFGLLGKLPLGTFVVRTLGHMESSSLLQRELGSVRCSYPVGLSGCIDPHRLAHLSLAQIGFGLIEIGPVTAKPIDEEIQIQREDKRESILFSSQYSNIGVDELCSRLQTERLPKIPMFFRISPQPGSSVQEAKEEAAVLTTKLAPFASGYWIDVWSQDRPIEEAIALVTGIMEELRSNGLTCPLLLYIPLDYPQLLLERLLASVSQYHWSGYVIGEYAKAVGSEWSWSVGREGKSSCIEKLRLISRFAADGQTLVAAAGAHQPADALELMHAGADFIMLNSGLVYAGPGLPKRINEAIQHERLQRTDPPQPVPFWRGWGWLFLLGMGMMLGGIMAWYIAATTVLLPYDEAYLAMSLEEIGRMYPQLVHFMSHDRITLAGTMISIGIIYAMLARYGLRYSLHWAKTAYITSCLVGFASFFLYLGYGYFDPLHAAAALILLPMFLAGLRSGGSRPFRLQPNLHNSQIWRTAQWGQLMFVMLGFAFAVGGLVISAIGITDVFVQEDLAYMGLTAEEINRFNSRLIPMIAHDRAGFGGALFSDAIAITGIALWGIREGERWMWWMLLFGGLPGFVAGFGVHGAIGYTDWFHLLPAFVALALYVAGLILLYPYLTRQAKPDNPKMSL